MKGKRKKQVKYGKVTPKLTEKVLVHKLYNVLEFCGFQLARWMYWKHQWKENIWL
jgi:hypothetical protein